jgi:hypothetical protein
MANKRMFSSDIVESDAFLAMPPSSQALYFHLAMAADDDGFVQPKRVMRFLGSADDEIKVLITKRFILPFESGVVVIKHWLIHNLIRADLYHETQYKNEKYMLGLNENGAYTELRDGVSEIKQVEVPKWLQIRRKELRTANVPQTARSIGKDRIVKDSKEDMIIPEWINKDVWNKWENHRREIKKKLTPTTVKQQIKFLEENQKNHILIIERSIQNGWTGLFPLQGDFKPGNVIAPKNDKYKGL